MKKPLLISNIILILAILVGDILYITIGGLLIKSLTSLGFVALGLINLIFALKSNPSHKKFVVIIFIGLVFAMLGDIVLEIEFIIGALLFAIGHIFFFVSYCTLQKFQPKNLILGACIFVPFALIILFVPIFDFGGVLMQIVCLVYALIISFMAGKAITNLIHQKSTLNIVLAIGSLLFMFSDFMLLFNVFSDVSRVFGILCLLSYYPAEIFLAYSINVSKSIQNV